MATSVFFGYSSSALVYDAVTDSFTLDPDYDFTTGRVRFEITDGDDFLDGDEHNDEVGEDADQTGTVTTPDGTPVASGKIYGEQFAILQAPDGSQVTIDRIEIAGVKVGYVPSEPLQPGMTYSYVGGNDIDNALMSQGGIDTRQSYADYEALSVPCFGPGTMIMTQDGEIPVEWLETSDMVLTRDNGYQSIAWIARTRLPPSYFLRNPNDKPLCFPAGSLGEGRPTHDLHVTGDHRILLSSAKAELMFGSHEVLVPAKAWLDSGYAHQITPTQNYTITHIMCSRHQVIVAEGAWAETMFPGEQALSRLSKMDLERLEIALGPELHLQKTARPCIARKEARLLISQNQGEKTMEHIEPEPRSA